MKIRYSVLLSLNISINKSLNEKHQHKVWLNDFTKTTEKEKEINHLAG